MNLYQKSDVGLIRKSNEDACRGGGFPDGAVWAVVCDGMGGVNGGNVASATAVDAVEKTILAGYSDRLDEQSIHDLLFRAVNEANAAVFQKAGENDELKGMGTTIVAAIISKGTARIIHVGDSRAYMVKPLGILQLTVDHSMVQEMVEKGDITQQEAKTHPQKNIITRALGVNLAVRADYGTAAFGSGDLLLICTDGLSNNVDEDMILNLSHQGEVQQLPERLVRQAILSGGSDNITVVVIAAD